MFTIVQEGGGEDSFVEVPVYCIKDIMKMLNHDRIDIFKMDIEGSEYDVIDDVIDANIDAYQMLIEFHHRFQTITKQKAIDAIAKLRRKDFDIFSIFDLKREYSFLHTPSYPWV
jgi:hypothetical protein